MVIRHIEFSIDYDHCCVGYDEEDFERDTEESIMETLIDFLDSDGMELVDHLKINKIWYEDKED